MKLKRAAVRFRFADLATIDYAIIGYIPHINHVIYPFGSAFANFRTPY